MPAEVTPEPGAFSLAGATLYADPADAGTVAAQTRFHDLLAKAGGADLARGADRPGGIAFVREHDIADPEAYRLDVTPQGVTVRASGDAGLFYGAETLWQLAASSTDGRIAAVHIEDRPAYAWRGLMLDSVRHFQPVDFILATLDRMAEAKLNTFHWHLTDDQGWRLQIDKYPRLTSVGAWRSEAGTGARYGGFYTKAEVRRVVAYAAARHITVVPEIEMPGHATAMIAAYPALASTRTPPKAPSNKWGVLPDLLDPSDASFTFVENVLDEVMQLFPGTYIHTGGDEAPKDQWKANPRIQAQIKALGLHDEDALQGWFTARIADYLAKHGRKLVGWDEILDGNPPKAATVMSWHGMDGAIKAARAGHDAILAPAPDFYLDNRQSDAADETPGRGEVVGWKRIYTFDLGAGALTGEERAHILGLQSNLFTEHVPTTAYAERMLWPRAAEVAELGWSPPATRDWQAFAPRLLAALGRWDRLGWTYDTVPLAPEARIEGKAATLAKPAAIGTLRVATGGGTPTATSSAYAAPVPIDGTTRIAAQSFLGDRPVRPARTWTFTPASLRTRIAADMPTCDTKLPFRLVDPVTHAIHWVDVMQACWRWPAAPLDDVTRVSADIGQVPFNIALSPTELASVTFAKPATPLGELEIRQDSCDGPRIAVLPLVAGASRIAGRIAPTAPGAHDLCMTFTQKTRDPLRVLDRLTLEPGR